jgi:quercetin dioxygenase-like cupin family protein
MNNSQLKLSRIFLITLIGLISSVIIPTNKGNAQTMESYKVIDVTSEIADGKEKEVNLLFEGERRKIVQLTLRNGKNLEDHSVKEPIVIHCVAGEGELIIKYAEESNTIKLLPGTFVTVEGNVMHDVIGKPSVSIVLIRFLEDKNSN